MSSPAPAKEGLIGKKYESFNDRFGNRLDGIAFGSVSAVLILLAGVFIVRSDPRPEVELRLADGAVWLPSASVGGVSLLDGSDGSISVSLGVADKGDDFSVVQWGSDALIVNQGAGTVSRLDGADWTVATGRVQFGQPGESLEVVVGQQSGWLLQEGSAAPLDLETLQQRSPVSVPGAAFDAAVSENGSLLLSVNDDETPVQRVSSDALSINTIKELTGRVALQNVGGAIAGVDLSEETVWLEGKGVVCDDLGLSESGEIMVGGADGMLLAVSDEGNIAFWSADGCPTAEDYSTIGPGIYGTPVVTQGWAVIPDIGRNELLVLDSENGLSGVRLPVDLAASGTSSGSDVPGASGASVAGLELVAETGAIWYNDAASSVAGLVQRRGKLVPISKYDDASDSGFVAAADDSLLDNDLALAGDEAPSPKGPVLDDDDAGSTGTSVPDPAVTNPMGPSVTEPRTRTTQPARPPRDTPDPLGPVLSPPTTDPNGDRPTVTIPTPSTSSPEITVVPTIGVQLAATATQVQSGESISFRALTTHGSPQVYVFSVSPNTGTRLQSTSNDRFSYRFTSPGTFYVSVQACDTDNACVRKTVLITVVASNEATDLVAAIVAPLNITVGEQVVFRDASTGDVDEWLWSFAGGAPATSSEKNASVRFDTAGSKLVELRVTSPEGESESADVLVEVLEKPAAISISLSGDSAVEVGSTSSYEVIAPQGVELSDTTWVANGGVVTNSSAGVQVLWPIAGSFEVEVSAIASGQQVSASLVVAVVEPVTAQDPPIIRLTGPSALDVGQVGTYVVSNSGGPVSIYSWESEGRQQGSGTTVTFSFDSPGNYLVRSTSSGPGGEDTDQLYVEVSEPAPEASPFGMACGSTSMTAGESTSCSLQGDPADFTSIDWSVSWPDSAFANSWSTSSTEFHVGYLSGGSVVVTLSALDLATGSTRSRSVTLTFDDPVEPSVPAPSVSITGPATVIVGSAGTYAIQNSGGQIDSLAWSSSGHTAGTGTSYSLTWTEAGTYEVAVLTNGPGGSDAATMTVVVTQLIASSFSLRCPTPVNVGDISYCQIVGDPSKFSGFSWSIAWPDSSLSESWNGEAWTMNVGYQAAGSFGVTLRATDIATGKIISASATVTFQ